MMRASGSNSPRFFPHICRQIQLRPVVCRTSRIRTRTTTNANVDKYGRNPGGRRYGVTAFGGSDSPRKFPQRAQAAGGLS
jgi:hypothetical protein